MPILVSMAVIVLIVVACKVVLTVRLAIPVPWVRLVVAVLLSTTCYRAVCRCSRQSWFVSSVFVVKGVLLVR